MAKGPWALAKDVHNYDYNSNTFSMYNVQIVEVASVNLYKSGCPLQVGQHQHGPECPKVLSDLEPSES